MDEYDEYGGYDEPAPPPRPTGLRQRGQSASQEQQGVYQPQQPGYGNPEASQHGYPNLGRQAPTQQQQGFRSVTNPPYQTPPMARLGSFNQGDERRAFSAAHSHQGMPPPGRTYPEPTTAIHDYSSGQPMPQNHHIQPGPPGLQHTNSLEADDPYFHQDRGYPTPPNARAPHVSDLPGRTSMGSRTHSMTSNTSLMDFHNRRDFSPSALPPPLHTRGSPSPHNRPDSQSGWHPPRKSSLTQQNQSDQLYGSQELGTAAGFDSEEREPSSQDPTGSDTGKTLPFVRPADIYRRMQEDKERQRQSQDSSRPSMDAIIGDGRTGDEPKSDTGRGSERGQDIEATQSSRSTLDPVAERKSEYGMDGLPLHETDPSGAIEDQRTLGNEPKNAVEPSKFTSSPSPQLPDVARMSSFGALFESTPQQPEDRPDTFAPKQINPSQATAPQPLQDQPDATLQHQPSLGLRSVVHQAFDTTNDQIPQTPASSTADSSIGRSGSGGTSVVSPIISRGPSSATANLQSKDPHLRPATPPTMDERMGSEDRPHSSGALGTPKAIVRKPSSDPAYQRPGSFIPGHRRDLSTPSPDNSPARTPAVEAIEQLQQPQEAELAMTTPIETRFPHPSGLPETAPSSQMSPVSTFGTGVADISTPRATRGLFRKTDSANSLQSLPGEAPKSPAESTRSRVRNLADRFESGRSSPAGSERAPSPVKTTFIASQASQQPRPLAGDRMESFRPRLPGGWESSVSLAPPESLSKYEPASTAVPLEQRLHGARTDRPTPSATTSRVTDDRLETARHGGPGHSQTTDEVPSSDPFASLAAAGSALAGAFSGVLGSDDDERSSDRTIDSLGEARRGQDSKISEDRSAVTRPRAASGNTAFMPEASRPTMLETPDDGTSSIMPTPLDKLSRPTQSGGGSAADYFATGATPKQQWSGDSYATENTVSSGRSALTPSLSIDTGPQYESDRLRREIIRELSPRLTSEPSTAKSDSPLRNETSAQVNSNSTRHPHESMVLPREYDSYWNGSGSEQSSRASSVKGSPIAARDALGTADGEESTISPSRDLTGIAAPAGVMQSLQSSHLERPNMPSHRFSWEGPSEVISSRREPLQDSPQPPFSYAEHHDEVLERSEGQSPVPNDAHTGQQAPDFPKSVPQPAEPALPPSFMVNTHSTVPCGERPSSEEHQRTDTGRIEPRPAAELPAPSGLTGILDGLPPPANDAGPQLDMAQLDEGQRNIDTEADIQPQSMDSTDNLPPPPAKSIAPPKIQSFREILAMKEPKDRIRAYNESREQFAKMDTGLAHWLAVTIAELPEHQDVLPDGRLPGVGAYKPSPSRSKFGGLLSSGNTSAPQPYYEQYLNASSPSGVPEGSQMPRVNPTQGYSPSPSSGKLSSQQMQARGKDLLHTAGVFGGKANIAAKGLFSKGKSKFRGGNADKVDK